MDGQQWVEEMRRIKKVLGELGHYISGPTPMRCQYCKVVAGILSLNPKPCPKGTMVKIRKTDGEAMRDPKVDPQHAFGEVAILAWPCKDCKCGSLCHWDDLATPPQGASALEWAMAADGVPCQRCLCKAYVFDPSPRR